MSIGDLVTCTVLDNRIGVVVGQYKETQGPPFRGHWWIFWHDMEGDDKDLAISHEDMLEVL